MQTPNAEPAVPNQGLNSPSFVVGTIKSKISIYRWRLDTLVRL